MCTLVTGVQTCVLPIYFKNLADLQDEVAAQIMATLRPLSAVSKRGLREQLLQFGVEFLEINRAHPYLLTIQGPATAAVIARHTKQCLKVLLKFGIDMDRAMRSEEHTSELQSLMRMSYAVFCLKKKTQQ